MTRFRKAILLLAGWCALPVAAQPPPEDFSEALEEAIEAVDMTMVPEGFGADPMAAAAWQALYFRKYVRAREIAQRMLEEDPQSIPGHCLMAMVHHRAEGNLPIALYHLERSRELSAARYGEPPTIDAPWFWHAQALFELAFVSGEMGRHEDKVAYLLERDELYEPRMPADRGWPLMRLRRYEEARAAAEEALLDADPLQVASARTALCAIEAEQQDREAGYDACLAAAEHARDTEMDRPTPFANAAEAALGMLRMDVAETYLQDATKRFRSGTVSNPWLDLTLLYVAEGRTAEALETVREMMKWRRKQPPFMDEQNRAETRMTSAIFLIVAGRPEAAARITARTLDRPDRTGFTSSESEQMEAAAALVDALANRAAAQLAAERASWSPLGEAFLAHLEALRHRHRAWSSGRRAAALLVDERILLATLRPYLAGSVEIPEWIEPDLADLIGPGVTTAAVAEARRRETLGEAEGYFLAFEAEAAYLRRRYADAMRLADEALAALPGSEILLRARMATRGAQAALERGVLSRAVELFDQAWQLDPGVLRRLGARLPTRFESTPDPIARSAEKLLRRSPRFREAAGGFRVRIEGSGEGGSASLLGPGGTVLAIAQVSPRAGDEGGDDLARRLAAELHAEAFAPRLDLTQSDIRSLDGAPTASGGGRSSERLKSVFSELTDEGS